MWKTLTGAVVLGLLAAQSWGAVPQPGVDRSPFGAQAVWPNNPNLETFLDRMQGAGIQWGRFDLCWWSLAELQRGVFDFDSPPFSGYENWNTGRAIDMMKARDIEPFPILCYANSLYDAERTSDPAAWRAAFGQYCYEAVTRYGDRVDYWEVWNEPNLDFFWGTTPDATDYAKMVAVAAPRIREADPDAVVVGAAVSGVPLNYLRTAFDNGLLDHVDAITCHPYRVQAPETAVVNIVNIRNLIAQYTTRDIPVWTGEWGYNTVWTEVTPMGQAKCLTRMMLSNLAADVELSLWFSTHAFKEVGNGSDPEWGLLDYSLEPRPSWYAMKALIERMPPPVHAAPGAFEVTSSPSYFNRHIEIFERKAGREYTVAVWDANWPVNNDSYNGRSAAISLTIPSGAAVEAYDTLDGSAVTLDSVRNGEKLELQNFVVMDYPKLIEVTLPETTPPNGWVVQ